MNDLFAPDPAHIQQLLRLDPTVAHAIDPNMFYMAGVAGNGGRMLVRYWVAETLAGAMHNIGEWYAGLRIVNPFTGSPADFPKFWQLLPAIDREGRPPADRIVALVRRAIQGRSQPLGGRMLSSILTRLRADKKIRLDPVRHGLLRLSTNDLTKPGESSMPEQLDDGIREPAYLCGRLLATYESLQDTVYRTAGESKVNLTIADRYYSLASVAPYIAFPKIVSLGRKHLAKLGRDRYGLKLTIERELALLCDSIKHPQQGDFPRNFSLTDQGRFALGYYHQRAHQLGKKKAPQPGEAEPTLLTSDPEMEGPQL